MGFGYTPPKPPEQVWLDKVSNGITSSAPPVVDQRLNNYMNSIPRQTPQPYQPPQQAQIPQQTPFMQNAMNRGQQALQNNFSMPNQARDISSYIPKNFKGIL